MVGVRQVGVAAGGVGERHDEAVREPLGEPLRAGVGPRGEVEQAGDRVAQGVEAGEDLTNGGRGRFRLEESQELVNPSETSVEE